MALESYPNFRKDGSVKDEPDPKDGSGQTDVPDLKGASDPKGGSDPKVLLLTALHCRKVW